MSADQTYTRKQLALRRLLTNGRGDLNHDAKAIVADLRRFCSVDGSLVKYSPVSGVIDEKATLVAIGRREVFERLERMLLVDKIEILTASERD